MLATASMYPNGVPTTLYSGTSSVGTPVTSLPSQCSVSVPYGGPIVPVTLTINSWNPAYGVVATYSFTDYLAPAIGTVCEVQSGRSVGGLPNLALSTLPLSLTNVDNLVPSTYTEVDSLVSLGSPGTITTSDASRSPLLRAGVPGLRASRGIGF
jgi:hypothetical protein